MRKQIPIILFLLFLINFPLNSQQSSESPGLILFNGIVMDSGLNSPLANTQIIINRKYFSVSDKEGKFSFYVNRRDTVVLTRLGYKTVNFIVSDTLTG